MKVKLLAFSQPFAIEGLADAQDLVAYCARVSNPSNQANSETGEKLIRYLIKQHTGIDGKWVIQTNLDLPNYLMTIF